VSFLNGEYEYDFEIPGRTPMMNEFIRWHWTKQRQHTKDLAWMIQKAVGANVKREPIEFCLLVITRYSHGSKKLTDWDGLIGGMKGLFDALTERHPSGIGLIKDDNVECILACPAVIPVTVPKDKPERTRIQIMRMLSITES